MQFSPKRTVCTTIYVYTTAHIGCRLQTWEEMFYRYTRLTDYPEIIVNISTVCFFYKR